jgi:O-methyltransferase involved in polyketide biosynthesis
MAATMPRCSRNGLAHWIDLDLPEVIALRRVVARAVPPRTTVARGQP